MKRLVCVILSAALLFCLSSCGQKPKIRREIDNSKLLRVSEATSQTAATTAYSFAASTSEVGSCRRPGCAPL